MNNIIFTILGKIGSYLTTIKWTKLKVSILINIVFGIIILFLFYNPKEKIRNITNTIEIPVPGKAGKLDTVFVAIPAKQIKNPVNQDLVKKYDSLKTLSEKKDKYIEAITENEYNEVYEDSNIKIDIYTRVQGKLLKQAPNYFIKPSTVKYKDTTVINHIYPSTNKLLIGVEAGIPLKQNINTDVLNPIVKGTVYFQNKKDNILSLGVDTNKYIWGGYIIKL